MNKKAGNFLLILFLVVVTRAYDIITTYIYTPTLSKESNVLVKKFHLTIYSSVAVQLLLLILVGYFLFIYYSKNVAIEKIKSDKSDNNTAVFYINKERNWKNMFSFAPSNRVASFYMLGYIIPKSLILISIIVGSSTLLLIFNSNYRAIYSHGGSIILSILCVVIVFYYTLKFYKGLEKLK